MTKPLISVVMSIYNEPENYLRHSIESILRQGFCDFEFIIVIDNPGHKKGYEIVRSYTKDDKRIKIISNDKNEGLAFSLNKAFSTAEGEYIARMDADDISFPERLKKQFKFMEAHPDVALIGSSMVYIDEGGKIIESRSNRSDYLFLKRYIFYGGTPCFHPTWFFKKGLLKIIKGYRILPTSQDYDFLMRVFFLGIKVSNIEEELLYHRIHPARISGQMNVYQLKLTRYIRRAAKDGFVMDDERFSTDRINGILRTPYILLLLHNLSLRLNIYSNGLKNKNRKIAGFLTFCISLFISPYRLYHGLQSLNRLLALNRLEIQDMHKKAAV